MLDKKLLSILACPVCKGDLIYELKPEQLRCPRCQVNYPVEKGIPNLLPGSQIARRDKKRK